MSMTIVISMNLQANGLILSRVIPSPANLSIPSNANDQPTCNSCIHCCCNCPIAMMALRSVEFKT